MVYYLITFGAGDSNHIEAAKRLCKQAESADVFDKIIMYTIDDLQADKEFWDKHSNFIQTNPRGFGYWLWKPYIIKTTMDMMNDGDILVYLDSGCEIDKKRRDTILEYFKIVEKDYIIGGRDHWIEKNWVKMDVILKLDMLDDKHLNTKVNQAGANMYYVFKNTRSLVNEWYELCCEYNLIDDTPSNATNLSSYIEHRHDQSIFSLLTKKYDLFSEHDISKCLDYRRNRTGVSSYEI
jgi:hypothetical protein